MEIESLELKTEKEYKEFLDYLFSIRDLEYRDFNTKIVVPVDCEIIGIRTPILRDIAKKIAKTSSENFLNLFEKLFTKKKVKYYEEKALYGFLIGYSKIDFQERLKRIDFFINIIDNWAVCDIVDSTFKFVNKFGKEIVVFPDFIRRTILFVENIREYQVFQINNNLLEVAILNITEEQKKLIKKEFNKLFTSLEIENIEIKFINYEIDKTKKLKRIVRKVIE